MAQCVCRGDTAAAAACACKHTSLQGATHVVCSELLAAVTDGLAAPQRYGHVTKASSSEQTVPFSAFTRMNMGSVRTTSTDTAPAAAAAVRAGKVLSPGELLTALEGAPLDTIYLDAAGHEKGEGERGRKWGRGGWCTRMPFAPTTAAHGEGRSNHCVHPSQSVATCDSADTTSR